MSFNPRPYQQAIHDAIFKEWESVTSTLVVAPTGTGKTCIFAMVCKTVQPKRAMVIAHREELIWQARDKIQKVTGLDCGIEMADNFVNNYLFGDMPVIISTIQTQNSNNGDRKRMGRFDPKEFGVLIVDESHHSTADSYKNLINYYKANNPDIKVLGVTATPDRSDEEALGQIFESVAFDYEILDAIHDGYLVPIDQQFVTISGLDFSHMRTTAGDLNGSDLAETMENEKNLQGVAGAALEIIGSRRTIVFTASVKQAEELCNIFNRHRAGMAAWVCGKTPKDDRRDILKQFQWAKTQIICNCGVLTEGFDDPGVEVIVMARPTKSRSLYAQMAGRSTRPLPDLVDGLEDADARKVAIRSSAKPSCLIVDFVGNSGRHKLMTSADILGGKVSDEAIDSAVMKAKKNGKPVRMSELLDEEEEGLQEKARKRRLDEEARKAKLVAKVSYNKVAINPFDVFHLKPEKARGWDNGRSLSEKQKKMLLDQGVNPDSLPYAQGRQLLNEIFRRINNKLCNMKQARVLQRFGYQTDNMTFKEALSLCDSLARNGWRRPAAPIAAPAAVNTTTAADEERSPF